MSKITDKRCPLCGSYIKLHTGDVHSCISCPFKCFEDDFDRVCAAMKAQAELDALKAAVMPVVDWYVRSKEKFPDYFTGKSTVLQYAGWDGVWKVTGAQLDALELIYGRLLMSDRDGWSRITAEDGEMAELALKKARGEL